MNLRKLTALLALIWLPVACQAAQQTPVIEVLVKSHSEREMGVALDHQRLSGLIEGSEAEVELTWSLESSGVLSLVLLPGKSYLWASEPAISLPVEDGEARVVVNFVPQESGKHYLKIQASQGEGVSKVFNIPFVVDGEVESAPGSDRVLLPSAEF